MSAIINVFYVDGEVITNEYGTKFEAIESFVLDALNAKSKLLLKKVSKKDTSLRYYSVVAFDGTEIEAIEHIKKIINGIR